MYNYNIHIFGVCDIYCLRLYRNCCLNDVQLDIIEYFAKTIQNTPTECTHTSCLDYCKCAFSVYFHCMIQSIKIHLGWKLIQDMGAENVYIYIISYSSSISQIECLLFSKNEQDYKCNIDFVQQFNKQDVYALMVRCVNIEYFCTLNETLVSCKICIIVCSMMLWSIYRGYFVEIWIVVSIWGIIFLIC